jgi:alkyldihydroxyacetonephosphate synthase
MQQISESDAAPSITRISDARETGFTLATSKDRKGLDKFMAATVLPWIMGMKWGKQNLGDICISFIAYEGSVSHAKRQRKLVERIIRDNGGLTIIGTGPGILYDQKKFDTPYLRDFLLDMGAAGDVSETATPWSKINQVHDAAYAAAQGAYDEIGIKGWIMSHMSHSYHSGACLYFTFAFVFKNDPVAEYNLVKNAIQQSFVDNYATISHHHGVGVEHSPWLEDDISAEGVVVMTALFTGADPASNFNPGKIIAAPGAEKSAGAAGRVGTAAAVKKPVAKAATAKAPATAAAVKAPARKAPAKAPTK